MNAKDLLDPIEAYPFIARVSSAPNWRMLRLALLHSPEFISLRTNLTSFALQQELVTRLLDFSHREVDPRYENPWDIPLATYLYALHLVRSPLRRFAAQESRSAKQCWWLSKMIELVSTDLDPPSRADSWYLAIDAAATFTSDKASHAGEVYILPTLTRPTLIPYSFADATLVSNPAPSIIYPTTATPRTFRITTRAASTAQIEVPA